MRQAENTNQYHTEKEITFKELILKLQEFYFEALRHWKLLFLIPIPFVAFMLYKTITTPNQYEATLTFMINEDDGNALAGVGAILGQFGLGGSRGKYNLDKIMELVRSRNIIQSALFHKNERATYEDFPANKIIKLYSFHEAWEEDTTGLKDFLFASSDISPDDRTANKALLTVYRKVVGGESVIGLLKASVSEKTGIMTLKVKTQSEALSIELCHLIYEKLSHFYVSKSTEKQEQTYDVMKTKTDSIKGLLNSSELSLAKFEDTNRNLLSRQGRLEKLRLQREVQILTIMYGEALKNLEIADFTLKNKTPFIQIIDRPIAPIRPEEESLIVNIIIGGFIGGVLGLIFIFGRKIIRDTMKEDINETTPTYST